jgi:2-polyprenyl-6-methoxyphenol hydroxylase-like FAD-dependent oxidoreductase
MEARVTANSQAYRLKERMEQAEVRHGQEIRADLPGLQVRTSPPAWIGARETERGQVFFCNMGPIRLRSVAIAGDGAPLPNAALVQGLNVAAEGTYDLINALVRSNGDLRVIVDEVTEVVQRRREDRGWRDPAPEPVRSVRVEA